MGGREEPDRPCGEWHHWPGSGEEGEQFGFSTLVFVVVACVCVCVCTCGVCVYVRARGFGYFIVPRETFWSPYLSTVQHPQ